MPSVTADNSGNYTCAAFNEAGQYNYTATLNVLGMILLKTIEYMSASVFYGESQHFLLF